MATLAGDLQSALIRRSEPTNYRAGGLVAISFWYPAAIAVAILPFIPDGTITYDSVRAIDCPCVIASDEQPN